MTALRDTDKALAGVQTKLDTLVTDIKALSISSSLSSLIGTDGKLDAATIADFMLSPTVISEQAVYPVASYGSGMAPLFTTLSLWVGAFVLVVIPKLETDDEGIDDLTPTQGYLGRFLLLATLAAVQGLVTAIGDLVIGIVSAHLRHHLTGVYVGDFRPLHHVHARGQRRMRGAGHSAGAGRLRPVPD